MPIETVLEEIRTNLQNGWLLTKRSEIQAEIRDMPAVTADQSAARNQRKKYLEELQANTFNSIWTNQII